MRVFDASAHNAIANHPSVRPSFPWVEGTVSFDEEVRLVDAYVFLLNDRQDAAAIFEWSAPRIWQVHILFLPSCRGRSGMMAARQMADFMHEEMGASSIWGQVSVHQRGARLFSRLLGATSVGFRKHPVTGECELFVRECG